MRARRGAAREVETRQCRGGEVETEGEAEGAEAQRWRRAPGRRADGSAAGVGVPRRRVAPGWIADGPAAGAGAPRKCEAPLR